MTATNGPVHTIDGRDAAAAPHAPLTPAGGLSGVKPRRSCIAAKATYPSPGFDAMLADDRVGAIQIDLPWAEIEPNIYDTQFGRLRAALDAAASAAKLHGVPKRIIPVLGTSGAAGGANVAPLWFRSAFPADTYELGGNWYPIFWAASYLELVAGVIYDLAAQFDGDDRIEYWRIGGWSTGTNEPGQINDDRVYGTQMAALFGPLGIPFTSGGRQVSTALTGDDPYSLAVWELFYHWAARFRRSRLAVTVKLPDGDPNAGFYQGLIDRAVAARLTLLNTGLNEGNHADLRARFREWRSKGARAAWGGTSNVGSKSNLTGEDLQLEVARQAIGTALPDLSLATHVLVNADTADRNLLAFPSAVEIVRAGLVA